MDPDNGLDRVAASSRIVIPRAPAALRLPERATLAGALIGIVALLTYTDSLWKWDQLIYDWQIRTWARAPDEAIAIVAIDERSLSALGRWPWSRAVHADLLDRLTAAGTRSVGLDIVFAEPNAGDPQGDQRLAQAITENARTVLPVVNEEQRLGGQLIELLPIPSLVEAAARLGHVDRQLDADAITRSAYLKAGLGAPHWPSFALAMLSVYESERWQAIPGLRHEGGAERFPPAWVRDHQIWIPFAGPPGHIPRVSFVDVLTGRVPAETLADKFVLVGATAAGLGDLLPTPVSGERNPMPGVEVVANELDTLLQGLWVLPVSFQWQVLLTSLLVLAPLFLYSRYPRWSLAVGVGFGCGILALSVILLRSGQYWFAPATALVTLFGTYAVWSWRRLVQSVRYLNQALRRLSSEPAAVHWSEARELGEAMAFLSNLLPVTGCAILDDRGDVRESWGRLPAVASHRPEVGAWLIELPAVWTAMHHAGAGWQVGFTWAADRAPDSAALRLLSNVAHRSPGGEPPTLRSRTPGEAMQVRIQQVQAATDRLQVMRRFITDTLAHMAHGVVVANGLGRVLMANSRAADYLGVSESEALTETPFDRLLRKLDIPSGENPIDLIRSVLLDGQVVEVAATTPAGKDVMVQISPYSYGQDLTGGLLLNLADVTALKESERRRQELMAFLSHDLRAPLTSIIAATSVARIKPESVEEPEFVDGIQQNAQRTLQLADDFLQLARAETVDYGTFAPVNVTLVAYAAIDSVHPLVKSKNMHLDSDLPDDAQLLGDGKLLERTFVNLLTNAIKYSPAGGEIGVGIVIEDDRIHCWVRDTGYGIADDAIPRLFKRFERIHRDEHAGEPGSGLGLSFVKTVVERHRGVIKVDSEVGAGTCIHLYFPVWRPPSDVNSFPDA